MRPDTGVRRPIRLTEAGIISLVTLPDAIPAREKALATKAKG